MAPTKDLDEMRGNSESTQLWKLDSIPGKGKGLLATQAISRGTLILSDAPLLITDCITSPDESTTEKDLARVLRSLPKESQREYLSLHNNFPGKNPLSNIVRSNGYPLGANSDVGGVFAKVARFNHSCRPNAKHSWNKKMGKYTVYALRDISEGEEFTLSYLAGGASEERKEKLKTWFGFDCACEICALPLSELKASDGRLLRAEQLNETIGNIDACRNSPAKVLKMGRRLLDVYREEKIADDRLPNLYYDIFQVVNMHGDQARASAFASAYCELKVLSEGPDSADAEEVRAYVKNPAAFARAKTQDWKSAVGDVPQGLDAQAFEKWLWKEE